MYGASAGLVVGSAGSGKGWMNGADPVAGADWAWAGAQTEPAISAAIAAAADNKSHAAIHVTLSISSTPAMLAEARPYYNANWPAIATITQQMPPGGRRVEWR